MNCFALSLYNFGSVLRQQNKTLTPTTNKTDGWGFSKTAFRKGAESSFCLWQELKSTNEKIAKNGDRSEFFHIMAGEKGIEPLLPGPKPGVLPLDDSPSSNLDL